jgi:hypothetical protein
MPFSKPDLTEVEMLQLNAQERQVLADKYSTLSAEERTALPLNPTS